MRSESREFGLANGHSPLAEKVICIDFDGTLYPFGELFSWDAPNRGAVRFLNKLHEEGWKIVIFTSRLSHKWLEHEDESYAEQLTYIKTVLQRDGIPYEYVTSEKIPAEYYVDDKAITYDGIWADVYHQVHKHTWVGVAGEGTAVCADCAKLKSFTEADDIKWWYRGEQDPT